MNLQRIKAGLKDAGVEPGTHGHTLGAEITEGTVDAAGSAGANEPNEHGPYIPSTLRCAHCGNEITPGTPCCGGPTKPKL